MDYEQINIIENNCIICLEDDNDMILFDCNHTICISCYEIMLNTYDVVKCPICRHVIEDNNKEDVIIPTNNIVRIMITQYCSTIIFLIFIVTITAYLFTPVKI